MKVAIIDDESSVRETLRTMLELKYSNIEIQEAKGVSEGVELLQALNPDLVFMDIRMGDGTGFDLLNRLKKPMDFQLVFVTAHNEYAVKAFKFSAIDYILKPVDHEELFKAVDKALAKKSDDQLKYQSLLSNALDKPEKLVLSDTRNIHLVDIKDIVHCQAISNYTHFFLIDGKELVISKTLKHYEEILSDTGFYRVHHSHIINLSHFSRYDKQDGGQAIMKDGSSVPVSSRKREELVLVLKEFLS